MSLQSATIIDYVAGRLDDDSAREVERASKCDARLAGAIADARALDRRMKARLAVGRATARVSDWSGRTN